MELVEFLLFVVKPLYLLVKFAMWMYNSFTKELPEVLQFEE